MIPIDKNSTILLFSTTTTKKKKKEGEERKRKEKKKKISFYVNFTKIRIFEFAATIIFRILISA